LHNILQSSNAQLLFRDYERGLTLLKNRMLIANITASSVRSPSLLEQLQSKSIATKQNLNTLAGKLMNNPTDSTFLNRALRDIAIKALSEPSPDDSIRASLAHLDPSTLRSYAKRDIANSLRPDVELRLKEDYPSITNNDINASTNVLTDYGLDESERKIFGEILNRTVA